MASIKIDCLIYSLVFSAGCGLVVGCGNNGSHQPLRAGIGQFSGKPGKEVSYETVKPIFEKRCGDCHGPSNASMNWLDYKTAKVRALSGKFAARALGASPSMPPLSSPQAAQITKEERELIGQWELGENEKAKAGGEVQKIPSTVDKVLQVVQSCTSCHGENGVSVVSSDAQLAVPNLAGQKSAYILLQLKAYKAKTRTDRSQKVMNSIAEGMSADDMQIAADFFSRLDPIALINGQDTKVDKSLVDTGKTVATSCAGCHQMPGLASQPEVPMLFRQKSAYLFGQLDAFRKGSRKSDALGGIMNSIAGPLADPDLKALAAYFSSLDPESAPTPVAK